MSGEGMPSALTTTCSPIIGELRRVLGKVCKGMREAASHARACGEQGRPPSALSLLRML